MNTSCVLPSSSFSLSRSSPLLWAVIDLISSSLNWSHDSCCSDWPSLTTHRHSSVMPSPIYLSICLCLLSLSLPSGKSTCCPRRATMVRCAPVCDHDYWRLLSSYKNFVFPLGHLSVNLLKGFNHVNQHSKLAVVLFQLSISFRCNAKSLKNHMEGYIQLNE